VAVAVLSICGLIARADIVYEPLLKFGDPHERFTAIAFTPDARQVLSSVQKEIEPPGGGEVTYESTIVLWDLQTGQQLRVFESGCGPVAVSPDGKWGLSGSETNAVKLWNLQTGELLRTFTGHTNSITAVAFSPDGQQVLTGSTDRTARLWDVQAGVLLHAWALTNPVVSAVFSPNGRYVLTGQVGEWDDYYRGGPPRLWDAQTGELVRAFEGACAAAAFAMGGRSVLALRADTESWGFSLWDIQTSQSVSLSTGFPSFTVSPDGRLTLIHGSGKGGPPRLVHLACDRIVRWFDRVAGGCFGAGCAAFSPDGRRLVIGASCTCTSTTLWDIGDLVDWLAGGRLNQPDVVTQPLITIGHGYLDGMAMAPDGSYFVTAGNRGALFWDAQTGEVTRRLGGREGNVYSVDISPDGKRILTGGDSPYRTVILWDAETGQPLRTFCQSVGSIQAKLSAAGTLVVTESVDFRSPEPYLVAIRVWDTETGNLLRTVATRDYSGGLGARFSPDGSRVLDGTPQEGVKVYDVSTGQVIWASTDPPVDKIDGVGFSPDGRLLVLTVWHQEGQMRVRSAQLWDLTTQQRVRTLCTHTNYYWLVGGPVRFSPDSRQALIVAGSIAEVREVATGQLVRSWSTQSHNFRFVVFTADGRQVLMAEDAKDISLMDVETGQRLRAYPPGPRRPVVFAPEGRRALTSSADGAVQLWDAWTWALLRTFEGSAEPFIFSPDGRQVLTGSADRTARLYDAQTGERLASFPGQTNDVRWADGASSVVLSPNRRRGLTLKGNTAELWDVETGLLLDRFPELGGVSSAVFSPDGTKVLALGLSPEDAAGVWHAYSGSLVNLFPCDFRWALVFSPDGQRVLIGVEGNEMKLCDAGTGEVLRTLSPVSPEWGGMGYQPIRFSPDGTLALIGATLWDLQTGKPLRRLASWPEHTILCSAFSPNGREILTASDDGSVCLWDAATGHLLRTFEGPEYWGTHAVSFSPDGVLVAIETWDGVVDIWDLRDRAAGLRTSVVAGRLELRWQLGTLQSADTVNGPWQDVTNAISPFLVDLAAGARFYRVKVEEWRAEAGSSGGEHGTLPVPRRDVSAVTGEVRGTRCEA
jgi:WD40 repeat protein